MSNALHVGRPIPYFTKRASLFLSMCLLFGAPLLAADQGGSSSDPQPATTANTSSPQASSARLSNPAPVVAVSASHYSSIATPSASAGSGPSSPQQALAFPAPPDPDSGWTPATYVNSWLPSWLRLSGEFRDREEGRTGIAFKPGNDDAYGLTRVRIDFDITPNSWFHAFVQARDSEVIGANPKNVTGSMKDVLDLSQAYIELRNGEHGWFSLKTGRQELYFGDERLVARSNWSNASRSFDAVRLTLGTEAKGEVLDVFAASVVKNYPTSFDEPQPGRNFYGVNLALTKLIPWATLEPYVYLKTVPSVKGFDKKAGDERLYTSGLRWSGTIPGGFDYRARYSIQSGHFADNSIHAWAWYTVFGYTVPGTRLKPHFSIEYNYGSGNRSISGPVTGTFDLLYPTTHQWRRIADLFGEENITDLKPGFDFTPTKKMKVYFEVSDLSLASRYDSLYDSTGAVLVKVPKGGALSKDIGTEGDLYGTYEINRRLQIGAGIGHLYAGPFIRQNSQGASASYPYGFLDYHF